MVTLWQQITLTLPHESAADQHRMAMLEPPATALVSVLTMVMVTFVPSQLSNGVGLSKSHIWEHSTVLSAAHVRIGGVVSTLQVIRWTQVAALLHPSLAT